MNTKQILIKLSCVAVVVCLIFPMGRVLFPLIANEVGDLSFGAIEAVFSTSVGFGLYAVLFG